MNIGQTATSTTAPAAMSTSFASPTMKAARQTDSDNSQRAPFGRAMVMPSRRVISVTVTFVLFE
jgi:hypothetical protein